MRVFYVRCSTIEQNEARQIKMAQEQNAEKVFADKASGKNTDRAAFKEMMAFVRAGDTVVVESISRIARNTRDLLSIVSELTEKGVEFVSLKENIDTTTPQGRFMLTVFGALAELERENILERQREGIEIAKSEGKYKGRKPIDYNEAQMKALCKKWRAGEITATAAMTGVIYGLFLYKSRPNLKRCFLASLTNSLAVTLAANSLMIHFVFGPELVPLIAARSAETLIMLALQTVVMTAIASSDTLYNKIIAFGR